MTANEAFELISHVTPCWDCRYKSSSCNRSVAHVWADGFCHEFDAAIAELAKLMPEPQTESEPQESNGEENNG